MSSASATKYSTEERIGQNETGRSFELSHKRKTKLGIGLERIERGRIVQLGERRWRATTSFTSMKPVPLQVRRQSE